MGIMYCCDYCEPEYSGKDDHTEVRIWNAQWVCQDCFECMEESEGSWHDLLEVPKYIPLYTSFEYSRPKHSHSEECVGVGYYQGRQH